MHGLPLKFSALLQPAKDIFMRKKTLNFISVLIIAIFLVITLLITTGCSRNQESLRIIWTSGLQGAALNLPCSKSIHQVNFYSIPEVMTTVKDITDKSQKSGVPVVTADGGNTLWGIDDYSLSQRGSPVIELLKDAKYDFITPSHIEYLLNFPLLWSKQEDNPLSLSAGGILPLKSGSHKENEDRKLFLTDSYKAKSGDTSLVFFSFFEPEESHLIKGVTEAYKRIELEDSLSLLNQRISEKGGHINILIAHVNNLDELVQKVENIDVIIPGRFQDQPSVGVRKINNTYVLPYINSRYMGAAVIDLSFDRGGEKLKVSLSYEEPAKTPEMPAIIEASLNDFYNKFGTNYEKVHTAFLGFGAKGLFHPLERPEESPAANIIADMIRNYSGAEICLINLLSVRKPLEGIIRGEDVEWVLPFGNRLVMMSLTGAQIEEIMKMNLRRDTKYIVPSGIKVEYDAASSSVKVYKDGIPLQRDKLYRTAVNDYLAESNKIEYKIFSLGKDKYVTKIPINGIFLEELTRRSFLTKPPARSVSQQNAGDDSGGRHEENSYEAALEAYAWGDFTKAHDKLTDHLKTYPEDQKAVFLLAEMYLYAGLPGRACDLLSRFESQNELDEDLALLAMVSAYSLKDYTRVIQLYEKYRDVLSSNPETYFTAGLFTGSALYGMGEIIKGGEIWERLAKNSPDNLRLQRLSESIGTDHIPLSPPLWSKFKGDLKNTGRTPHRGTAVPPIEVLWKFETHHSIKSSPAVSWDGTVYLAGGDGIFYAVSPEGGLKWKYNLSGFLLSSPAIGKDGTIYVGTDAPGSRVRRQTFKEGQAQEQTGGGFMTALNPDGTLKWQTKTGGWIVSSPLITPEGNIIAGCNDHFVYSFSPEGEINWRFETKSKVFSSPAMDDQGTIYIGSEDHHFYAINPDGSLKWKFEAGNKFFSSPSIDKKGIIYTGNDDGHVYAFTQEGKLLWKEKFPSAVTSTISFLQNGDLVIGCENGALYRMTPDREIKWTFKRENEFFSSPIIDPDDRIYIGCEDNYLYCVSPQGEMLWKFETGDYVESTPVIAKEGILYLAAEDNYLYALTGSVKTKTQKENK